MRRVSTTPEAARPPAPLRVGIAFALALLIDAALLALALGGVPALLGHPRALALLAVWAPAQLVLAVRQPARAFRAADRARESPLALLVLFVIPLVTPPLSAWTERIGLWQIPGEGLRWAGVALSGAGYALRVAAMSRLGSRFSPRVELQQEHRLETGGPYAWVRHPGYLGAWLAVTGAALAFGSLLGLVAAALMWLALNGRMRREEALLAERFGAAFDDWKRRTGRFLPRPARH
jgi:protein-S-isoprenylcysteine O-methyltransferase Ste14